MKRLIYVEDAIKDAILSAVHDAKDGMEDG